MGCGSAPASLRGRIGEQVRSVETAAVDDVCALAARATSRGMFVVRPVHNPIGPFDFAGVYDEASDRHRPVAELVQQGHERRVSRVHRSCTSRRAKEWTFSELQAGDGDTPRN